MFNLHEEFHTFRMQSSCFILTVKDSLIYICNKRCKYTLFTSKHWITWCVMGYETYETLLSPHLFTSSLWSTSALLSLSTSGYQYPVTSLRSSHQAPPCCLFEYLLSLWTSWGQGLSSCPRSSQHGRRVASLMDKENTRCCHCCPLPLPSLVLHQLAPSVRWNFDRLLRASGIPLCQAQSAGISLWSAGSAPNWAAVTSSLRLNGRWNSSRPTRQSITQL